MMTYTDPDTAFQIAIRTGRLSDRPDAPNYAGRFMYMGTRNGIDLFKHIDTRTYLPTSTPPQRQDQTDHTRSAGTQPYRATHAAQNAARTVAPYRCATCKTPHSRQLEADLCCPANEITDRDDLARILGRRLGGI